MSTMRVPFVSVYRTSAARFGAANLSFAEKGIDAHTRTLCKQKHFHFIYNHCHHIPSRRVPIELHNGRHEEHRVARPACDCRQRLGVRTLWSFAEAQTHLVNQCRKKLSGHNFLFIPSTLRAPRVLASTAFFAQKEKGNAM